MADGDNKGAGGGVAGGGDAAVAAGGGAAAGDNKTILAGDNKAAAAAGAVKATWPETWREEMSGGDAKELERLKRFAAPGDIYKGFREAEAKITSGAVKSTLPENATAEQLATFRKENGIPETPDKYEIKLSNGVVVGEADKPIVGKYLERMHKANMSPAAVNAALDSYYALQAEQTAAREKADGEFRDASLLALGKEYGPELQRNLTGVQNMLGKHFPGDAAAQILAARTPDGKRIGDIPGIVQGFVSLMRDANPGATLVPAGTTNIGKSVSDRLGELRGMMGDPSSKYWKGADAAKFQQEFRDLVTAEQQMKGQAA